MYSDNPDIQVITISRGDREANRLKAAEQKLKFPPRRGNLWVTASVSEPSW
jgi:hypothetical protein